MLLTPLNFVLTEISAGTMDDGTAYASVTGVQTQANDDRRKTGFGYGSPVLKIRLIDPDTNTPNIKLATDLRNAQMFLKEIVLNCRTKITKNGIQFECLTAEYPASAAKKAV